MIVIHTAGAPRPPGGIPRAQTEMVEGTLVTDSFYPFDPDTEAYEIVQQAIEIIAERTNTERVRGTCDDAFTRIRGTSFSELFYGTDTTVTLFRSPTTDSRISLAITLGARNAWQVTLSPVLYTVNPQSVQSRDRVALRCAATIVHELAHCAGAPDRTHRHSMVAETTLRHCGFPDQFDPSAAG